MRRIALWVSAAVFGATVLPAFAQSSNEPLTVIAQRPFGEEVSIRVPYWDLTLSRPGEVDTLYKRVRAAARRGCAEIYGRSYVSQKWNCQDLALMLAQPQIARAVASRPEVGFATSGSIVLAFAPAALR